MSGEPEEDSYELRTTSTVGRALSETLPEAVAAAAYEFIMGPLLKDPYRVGKRLVLPMNDRFSARRGTYGIIYLIDDKNRIVTVVDVDHRRDAHRTLVHGGRPMRVPHRRTGRRGGAVRIHPIAVARTRNPIT